MLDKNVRQNGLSDRSNISMKAFSVSVGTWHFGPMDFLDTIATLSACQSQLLILCSLNCSSVGLNFGILDSAI